MESFLIRITCIGLAFSLMTFAEEKNASRAAGAASPQMARLADALVGEWSNVETMERSEFFPQGGERKGISSCTLATGGTNLVCEGASDGSAGPLHHLIVIWWDAEAKSYRFFTCFRERNESKCEFRGTAHWDGSDFVNDYSDEVNGKPMKMRDSFVHITHNSHELVAAIEERNGGMKTLITTRSTRR